MAPFSRDSYYPTDWNLSSSTVRGATDLETRLPPNAVVSAWYPLVSHIDHRTQVYVWPVPFAASNWGLGTDNGARLPFADRVQYLMLPVALGAGNYGALFASISKRYELMASVDGIGLYKRTG